MKYGRQIQRVRVTVHKSVLHPERIFDEIEKSLLGIEVDSSEDAFNKIYKCGYSVNLAVLIESVLHGILQKETNYWIHSVNEMSHPAQGLNAG